MCMACIPVPAESMSIVSVVHASRAERHAAVAVLLHECFALFDVAVSTVEFQERAELVLIKRFTGTYLIGTYLLVVGTLPVLTYKP